MDVVSPGDVITSDTKYMRGHGTYAMDGELRASVAGVVAKVNKLIYVQPLKSRYNGQVGDVVIGRILEVQQKRWKVETFSRLSSVLLLSSVNLPGGELRRRGVQDQRDMKHYLTDGDLISAEVQQVFHDGSLSLHTRSLKYGKLNLGSLICVPPALIKRCKNHFHNLLCGASIILGNNGYIWISSQEATDHQVPQKRFLGTIDIVRNHLENSVESREQRKIVARLRNCITALARNDIMIFDTTIQYTYEASLKFEVRDLLSPQTIKDIIEPATMVDTI